MKCMVDDSSQGCYFPKIQKLATKYQNRNRQMVYFKPNSVVAHRMGHEAYVEPFDLDVFFVQNLLKPHDGHFLGFNHQALTSCHAKYSLAFQGLTYNLERGIQSYLLGHY